MKRSAFALVRVVRGGVEPPAFRFSAGFAGPGRSITCQLTRPDEALAVFGIHNQPHVPEAVVSKVLARSGHVQGCPGQPRVAGASLIFANLDNSIALRWADGPHCSQLSMSLVHGL
jgi:hypothetical protein